MRVRNTSRYPTDEVRNLVAFGSRGIGTTGVVFNVKNGEKSYQGRTYHGIPTISPVSKMKTAKRLVIIRVGAPEKFPVGNMTSSVRWEKEKVPFVPGGQSRPGPASEWTSTVYYEGNEPKWIKWGRIVRHPYGGVKSPEIIFNDWRECIVGLAAHEARHHYQMTHGKRLSEVDAEKFAAKRLEAFRALHSGNLEAAAKR